ncbi:hypothetical protein HPB51_011833 [Rhipicephalus microplus]|uniref:Uncharacterized protein n=1 Tax=Rhipicephalus microplus TaxID=6941 RepID=A0A9J6EG89_RHIMP|nr:hypothetical protein HPB51_011833 [Rhipicephalus microplus]
MASAASSSGVKKRCALSLEITECVIRDIDSDLKKASVAAKYDVSDTTVSTIYKNKDKLRQQLQQDSSSLSRKRIRTSKYEDVDAALFRWFREVSAQSIPVSGPMLQQKAKCLGALLGHDVFNPLNGRIQRFKDRHGISCKVVCGESGAVDEKSIEVWLRLNLEKFVDAGESELSVCEEASTDDAIVAAVRGSAEVATNDESDGEDDVDLTPEPDFPCKDALEYLAKVKTFPSMSIVFQQKKTVADILYRRKIERLQPSEEEARQLQTEAKKEAAELNLNLVRICFTAECCEDGVWKPLCVVYSNPVANSKAGKLRITKANRKSGSCKGGDEVWILCEKINKKDILIKFFEENEETKERTWEAPATFQESDVHYQVAIVFKTPPYRDTNLQHQVPVKFQLIRKSDNDCSEPFEFIYMPCGPSDDELLAHKRRKLSHHSLEEASSHYSGIMGPPRGDSSSASTPTFGMATSYPGASIPVALFYSCHGKRSRRLEECTDSLFEELDNGNLSDVEGECDESGGSGDEGDDALGALAESESDSYEVDSEDDSTPATASAWARKPFKVPETQFKGGAHEDFDIVGDIPSPFGYFSRYIPKSVFTELAEKTNQYSVFQYGTCVNTDEDEISRMVALHLIMGVLKYPRLRLYWKPAMTTALIASCEISRNRFEKLHTTLHIVDANKPDINDRLWKVRLLLKNFQARCHDRWLDNRVVSMASNVIGVEKEETAQRWSKVDKCFIVRRLVGPVS